MEIPCRLRDVEEIISEKDLFYVPDDILECDTDYQIVVSNWWCTSLNLESISVKECSVIMMKPKKSIFLIFP